MSPRSQPVVFTSQSIEIWRWQHKDKDMDPIEELWQAILAEPAQQELRLAYVAALQEAGDPRAGIFAAADELRALSYLQVSARRELYTQQEELVRRHAPNWVKTVHALGGVVRLIEGWPEEVVLPAAAFIEHAGVIVRTIPLRHLDVEEAAKLPSLFRVAQMAQVVSLNFAGQTLRTDFVAALARAPLLNGLRWLDLRNTALTDGAVELLAASSNLKALRFVDLANNPCRNPVDAAATSTRAGVAIVPSAAGLPRFGAELEARYGRIPWLHARAIFGDAFPPSRYTAAAWPR
jgi:uncharacterized protein (TIGR02996 family)